MRTEYCGKVSKKLIGKKIFLCGWISKIKNFGHIIFFYIEDIKGKIQIILKKNKNFLKIQEIKNGFCVQIFGKVKKRSKKNINKNIFNGDIEIYAEKIKIFSKSKSIPIDLLKNNKEKNRLKYRYLDLRTNKMKKNLILRSKIIYEVHKFMQKNNFIHIETPIITKSTPEGARDYIIPSRNYLGKFYALPQSPQIFKQLIMISGFDRYYQIAKCFRDEDLRSNRQPEFTQIDIEASFVNEKKILKIIENFLYKIWKKFLGIKLKKIPKITYKESIKKYGTDKPDIRNPLKIIDFTKFFMVNNFLKENIKNRTILGIHILKKNNLSLKNIKIYESFIKKNNIKKILSIKINKKNIDNIKLNKKNILNKIVIEKIIKFFKINKNDIIIIYQSNNKKIYKIFGEVIKKISHDFNLIDKNIFAPIWITNFPMFKKNKYGNFSVVHHPFTSPQTTSINKVKKFPEKILSKSYDLIINGEEIGGGSIRINNIKMQKLIFKIINISTKKQKKKFGFFLNALKYGPPPHAGIALGLDRITMMLTNSSDIRDVISFPKTTTASCITTNSPNKINNSFLEELNIMIMKK
ncbi:aspartate--tRNA ligase [Buchnera aphidicola]|uniref:aspartate--tRNA ligase n=1 Tax=Buchnera aphidicola TaxID=9 RepID=UPI0031B8331D